MHRHPTSYTHVYVFAKKKKVPLMSLIKYTNKDGVEDKMCDMTLTFTQFPTMETHNAHNTHS